MLVGRGYQQQPVRRGYALELCQERARIGNVLNRLEADDEVEGGVVERQVAHVAHDESGAG